MSPLFWVAAVALGLPTAIVASYPIHALVARRRSRRYRFAYSSASVSVLVPVKGQDEGQTQVLRSLIAQQTLGSIEWLICVEDPADPAVLELQELAATDPNRIRVLITGPSGSRLGKMHNLIEGVAIARGVHLVFVDGDTILPHEHFLHDFLAPLEEPDVGMITCFPAYRHASSVPAAMLTGSINHDLLGHFALQSVWGGLRLANGSCMAVRRDVLERIGGFQPQEASLLSGGPPSGAAGARDHRPRRLGRSQRRASGPGSRRGSTDRYSPAGDGDQLLRTRGAHQGHPAVDAPAPVRHHRGGKQRDREVRRPPDERIRCLQTRLARVLRFTAMRSARSQYPGNPDRARVHQHSHHGHRADRQRPPIRETHAGASPWYGA